jgi:hypothetical protein
MRPHPVLALLLGSVVAATTAFGAESERVPPVSDPLVKKECGSCHLAFPPRFLSAEAWGKILDTLPRHFGEDASLPEPTRQTIAAFYAAQAGHSQPGLLRITQQSWWLREHRALGQARFAQAKSRANCVACHSAAEAGIYENEGGR